MSAIDIIRFMNERDNLQQKLNNIQEFLNYEEEHCIDNVDRKAPNIYKEGIYNSTKYIKVVIEQIMKGYRWDSGTEKITSVPLDKNKKG